MGIKTITMIVTDPATDANALKAALDLARREEAHLDIHCLGIDPTRYEALPAGSAIVIDQGREDAALKAKELGNWAAAQVGGAPKVSIDDSVVAQLSLERHVARMARYTDLVICAQPYGEERTPLAAMVYEAALFGAKAPVLIIPDAITELPAFNSVAIAWNESEESMAAIHRAIPIIAQSQKVDIVMVDPPARSAERSDPGGALAMWLARHGAKCEVSVLSKSLPRVGDVLMRFAEDHDVDVMVMGAYGHSRFREALMGGATRDLLEEAKRPILMAH